MSEHALEKDAAVAGTTARETLKLEVYGALLTLFGLALFLSLVTFDKADVALGVGSALPTRNILGPVGAHMADLFFWLFGLVSFLLDAAFTYIGIRAVTRRPLSLTAGPVGWGVTAFFTIAILLQVGLRNLRPFGYPPAGSLGVYGGEVMVALLGGRGAAIVSGMLLLIAVTYLSGYSLAALIRTVKDLCLAGLRWTWRGLVLMLSRLFGMLRAGLSRTKRQVTAHDTRVEVPRVVVDAGVPAWVQGDCPPPGGQASARPVADVASDTVKETPRPLWLEAQPALAVDVALPEVDARPTEGQGSVAPKIVLNDRKPAPAEQELPIPACGPYEPPAISLLDYVPPRNAVLDRESLHRNAQTLERKLLDYKVEGRVVEIHPGPVVTMYEFLPAPGIKISQIANLADDLTMALEATSIRIVAPIPGKGVVGIEVPNQVRETVYLREMLVSEEFKKSRSKLTLALGKDIFGNPMVMDLAKMPHLLIAGATGSGKSVAVNAFILSLVYNASPDEVRLILVDPKVVELQVYEGIPHLLLPVVYDPKHAAAALRWAVEEMERRYELLAQAGTRNIQSYNQRVEQLAGNEASDESQDETTTEVCPRKLPYIVIILDEFADLMMVASKDVETAVARLAQKARAAGIHLVMATQRPSKEVITGLIKANFPARVAFRVSSKIDSRIILDQSGAEALLGYGDMLFLRPGSSLVTRLHGPFVSDEEVHRVVAHLKQQGTPQYDMEILQSAQDEAEEEDPADLDPLLEEAQEIVTESRRASISFLQRKLKIGYNRSARIMEQLERRGIVGPPDARGERQVLV